MYLCTTDTSITGSVATGICYIYATGATSIASVAWDTTNAPVWRDDFQGYYQSAASAIRAIGGCYFDGSSYECKWIYRGYDTGPKTIYRYMVNTAAIGSLTANVQTGSLDFDNTSDNMVTSILLPDNAVVTEFGVETNAADSDAIAFYLHRVTHSDGSVTTLASITANSGDPDPEDTSISYELIDTLTYRYTIQGDCTGVTGSVTLFSAYVKLTEFKR